MAEEETGGNSIQRKQYAKAGVQKKKNIHIQEYTLVLLEDRQVRRVVGKTAKCRSRFQAAQDAMPTGFNLILRTMGMTKSSQQICILELSP